jgi:hypothetical protein
MPNMQIQTSSTLFQTRKLGYVMTTIENPNIKLVEYVSQDDDGVTTELIGYQCKVCDSITLAFDDLDMTLIVRSIRLNEWSLNHMHRS